MTNPQKDVVMHLVFDIAVGLGWLLMSAHRTASPVYLPAKRLLGDTPFYQMRAWGLILLVIGLAFATSAALDLDRWYGAAV